MDNISINIGGRDIPLRFRMNQFIEIEENVGNLGQITEMVLTGDKRLRNTVTLIRILGNAGLKHAGEQAELTEAWLGDNMDPYRLNDYQMAVLNCLSQESKSEAAKEETESKERDLVLEEIERKKGRVNSHTGA